jgi:hypothetical protein
MWFLTALVLTLLIYTEYTDAAIPLVWVSFIVGI